MADEITNGEAAVDGDVEMKEEVSTEVRHSTLCDSKYLHSY